MNIKIKIVFIIFAILFLPKITLADDTKNKKETSTILDEDDLVDVVCFDCSRPKEVFEILFKSDSFTINSYKKIDSLFYAAIMEINNIPPHGWVNPSTRKWLDAKLKDCKQITIPQSLFSLFSTTEQDSLYSIVSKIPSALHIADTLFKTENGYQSISFLICSINASINSTPTGEYILSLNNTNYKMVKLSENHYVLRKEEE